MNAKEIIVRPFLAGIFTSKTCSRVHQNTPFSFRKLKNFVVRGHGPKKNFQFS